MPLALRAPLRGVAVLAALLLLLSGAVAAAFPVRVAEREPGAKEVLIPRRPERVLVAGLPFYTEIVLDLGAGARLVGVTDSPDNPPQVAQAPRVGKPLSPNLERILALRPDLVLGLSEPLRSRVERAGIPVLEGGGEHGTMDDLESTLRLIRAVGLALDGHGGAAEALVARIRSDVSAVEQAVRHRARPTVAVLYPAIQGAPYAAGGGTPEDDLIQRAGGVNIFQAQRRHPQVSFEELLRADPDFILTDPTQVGRLREHPLLRSLRAVRAARLLPLRASMHQSSQVVLALRSLAAALHPGTLP